MTQAEYLTMGNLARIRDAQLIIEQIQPDYGASAEELKYLVETVERIAVQILDKIEVEKCLKA